MEGSTQIRLWAFLDETGTRQAWLAEQLGVSTSRLNDWLAGRRPVPRERQLAIVGVLRARQLKRIPRDLFDQEA